MSEAVTITPLERWHLAAIEGVPAIADALELRWDDATAARLALPGLAYAAVTRETPSRAPPIPGPAAGIVPFRPKVVAAAGLVPLWPGRASCWAILGAVPRRGWPAITAKTGEVLARAAAQGYRRIEAEARADQPPALPWLRRLGFVVNAYLKGWLPADENGLCGDAFLCVYSGRATTRVGGRG